MSTFDDWNSLAHHGIKGQKWGIRRFQNPDGTLTEAGKKHEQRQLYKAIKKEYRKNKAGDRYTFDQSHYERASGHFKKDTIDKLAPYAKKVDDAYRDSENRAWKLTEARQKHGNDPNYKNPQKLVNKYIRAVDRHYDAERTYEAVSKPIVDSLLGKYGKRNLNRSGYYRESAEAFVQNALYYAASEEAKKQNKR